MSTDSKQTIKNKKMIPVKANEVNNISEQIKYSEKTSQVTPDDVMAKINNAGAPNVDE